MQFNDIFLRTGSSYWSIRNIFLFGLEDFNFQLKNPGWVLYDSEQNTEVNFVVLIIR